MHTQDKKMISWFHTEKEGSEFRSSNGWRFPLICAISFYFSMAIEQAILDDQEIKMYLEDASKIYQPAVPYDDPQ